MQDTIAIIGLGLIGGSVAKSLKLNGNYKIFGYDANAKVMQKALEEKNIDERATQENLASCSFIILCLYPKDSIDYVQKNVEFLKKNAIIVDCVGVKSRICEILSPLCSDYGCHFIGGHPMAGIEKSGYDYSHAHMFDNATMVFCKDEHTHQPALQSTKELFEEMGFTKITYSTAEEHDKIIAFTSQLAHVVSSAYVQSDQAHVHMGFTGGSYKDMTRVAYLNENMWTELFIENKAPLVHEIRTLAQRLEAYAQAIDTENTKELNTLLKKGKEMKERVG